jgi:hypothetical protein
MSYSIASEDISIGRIEAYRDSKIKPAIIKAAADQKITINVDGLVIREAIPNIDFGQPAGSGYAQSRYITGAIAINTWTSVYDTAVVPLLPINRIAVFYKIYDEAALPSITDVRFKLGNNVTTLATFHIEEIINTSRNPWVWLSEPVVYFPQQQVFIECLARVAIPATGERLGFGCFIAERPGDNVS